VSAIDCIESHPAAVRDVIAPAYLPQARFTDRALKPSEFLKLPK
jgi:hypothetical protein